jgi:hypothetical protein
MKINVDKTTIIDYISVVKQIVFILLKNYVIIW